MVGAKKKFGGDNIQTILILFGTIAGLIFGSIVGPWAANLEIIGNIFLRLIQMTIVLLVMTSVISAFGGIGGKSAGKMGFYTFSLIVVFTIVSAIMGVALGLFMKPGLVELKEGVRQVVGASAKNITVKETILNFFSTNIIGSMARGEMVPCIIFSLVFGSALGMYVKATGNRTLLNGISELKQVIINIIAMVMKLAPIGIFCLLANVSGAIGFKAVAPMLKFLLVLLVGDAIQFLVYAPITALVCGVNVFKMPKKFVKMSTLALTTTSSAVCLPTVLEDTVTKFGVSKEVTNFVGPLAMSMNSSGSVLCNVASVIFLSQIAGIDMTQYQLIMTVVLSFLMCMGTIVAPGGAIIIYTFLADSVGIPLEGLGLLIAVDWFSGMLRTLTNVDVDVFIAMIVSKKMGDFDKDVYNEIKTVDYEASKA